MGEVREVARSTARPTWAHALRGALQTITPIDDFRRCGQQWRTAGVEVVVAPTGETRRIGYHSCGSVWLCPVCWSTRRIQERAEIRFAGEQWYGSGGGLGRFTLTVPHDAGETLDDVWSRLDDVSVWLRRARQRAVLRADFGVEHIIRAVEITWGGNGWHPHEHWIAFTRSPWDEPTRAGLFRWIRDRWRKRDTVNPHSPLYKPERVRPQDPQTLAPGDLDAASGHFTKGGSRSTEERYWKALGAGNDDLAAYLAPFAFGEEAANGDPAALALWVEYAQTTRGRPWIRWSNGSRPAFGLGVAGRQAPLDGLSIYLSKGDRSAPWLGVGG
jgi:hypothetical protein